VLSIAGVDGFRKISDLFLLEIWKLKPALLDKYLNSFVSSRNGPQFDIVRVWVLVASNTHVPQTLTSPIIPKSKWNMKKLLELVIGKKSETILRELFRESFKCKNPGLVGEMIAMCQSTHSITGTLRFPWAVETLNKWLSNSSNSSH